MQLEDVSRGKADLDEKNLRWNIMIMADNGIDGDDDDDDDDEQDNNAKP